MILFTTNFGDIKIELFEEQAPVTTANFIEYVKSGFYDGMIFHRVIPGFMVQGGGMKPGMEEVDGNAPIQNEANNGVKNERGTLAMARTMDPHSASSQFFINSVDNPFLDFKSETSQGWGYCVFAKVVEGMDVVDKISEVKTGRYGMHQDVPKEDVLIEKAEIIE
jgi:peptidyl-prolyl cis-trans isomerase B (cyclophilin B)